MRKFAPALVLAMFLGGASAAAQSAAAQNDATPRIEIAGGYSLLRSATASTVFNLHGGSVSVAGNVNDWLGLVADFGYYRNKSFSPAGFGLNIASYMFGPRVSYRGFEHLTPFAQQLVGVGHAGGTLYTQGFASGSGAAGPVNAFAMATGAGVDYNLTRNLAVRAVQAEWFYTTFPNGGANHQHNLRLTFGAVFRFGR
jgi:opacity protein-like surface antigen